jgi:hypothetical protein
MIENLCLDKRKNKPAKFSKNLNALSIFVYLISTMNKRISKFENFPYETEQLKVSKDALAIRVNVISGKDGDFWVCISPSLNVSGYGKSSKEAKKSFNENMDVFYDDIIELSIENRKKVLRELGWKQKRYLKKQFSKAFVDEDGILKNLEQPKLVSLQTVT